MYIPFYLVDNIEKSSKLYIYLHGMYYMSTQPTIRINTNTVLNMKHIDSSSILHVYTIENSYLTS